MEPSVETLDMTWAGPKSALGSVSRFFVPEDLAEQ